ncbi:putative multidrug resistance protein NorM [Rhodovastum atsumiense]|uniref:Multidrug-efflux transporter n=1 Tax=Rhodovastum atsumiense TaxID=504468 RepID=A0A5M6IQG4_9PROT|nr:MATE family efflux transporter [Rhodovastum atsumiense]KAA5610167.1 MATE family efflux transporter [Rhodovastum atsumiense]CAH2599260.1 putative multidrug resistance protein NorM [Rhodovastum atsumiense]
MSTAVTLIVPGFAQEARATLRLALPLVAGQVAQMGAGVIESMLAGHLGAQVLGAVAVGNSVWALAFMALVGVMMALSPSVAQLDGARRRREVAPVFVQAVWLGLGLGVVLGAATYLFGPSLAVLTGVDSALLPDIRRFLHAVAFGAPGLGLFLACRGLSDGLSLTRASMVFSSIGLLVLAPLGWALMYGRLGLPALGAQGAGIAWAVLGWVEGLAFAAWIAVSSRYAGLGWQAARGRPDPAGIAALLRLGAPMAVSVLLEVGLFSAAALVIGGFGPTMVAGHQIALNVAGLCFMVPLGLSMAMTVRVGNAVGRGDPVGVRLAAMAGLALVLVTQALSCTMLAVLSQVIAGLYTADADVIAASAGLLLLAAVFQFSDGIQVAAAGALRGLKDTRVPMLITAFSYWGVGMPLGLVLAFPGGLAAPGVWMGLIAGLTCAAVLLGRRLHLRTRLG